MHQVVTDVADRLQLVRVKHHNPLGYTMFSRGVEAEKLRINDS